MSGFGDNFEQAEIDPAAEFLAREQNELAGLEDEVKPAAATVISSTLTNGDEPTNSAGSFEMIENLSQDTIKQDNDIDIKKGSSNGTKISPPISLIMQREEPEKIRIWREEQAKRLEEKDKEEEQKKLELRENAKRELEEWYKNHAEAIAKTKAANRNAEKQFVAEDDEIEPGTEWERIAKLCDFSAKTKPGSKDVSRMRSIILQMKQNPVQIKNKTPLLTT
ncbi:clathrin light chain-like isoform X4 [Rhynchophorus ferrugineus]|uniref:clathrin light chain-like isoform X4 n=1 Tax=Rhynchophorus ferrugineus TaxID=354439 RepID=UPI003FCD3BC3